MNYEVRLNGIKWYENKKFYMLTYNFYMLTYNLFLIVAYSHNILTFRTKS